MLASRNNQHFSEFDGLQEQPTRGSRMQYFIASLVVFLVVASFYPVTQAAEAFSNALNAARIIELGFLGLAALVITIAMWREGCSMTLDSRALVVALLFAVWALLSTIWSANQVLTFARSATLLLIIYIAAGFTIYIKHIAEDSVYATCEVMFWALFAIVICLLVANWYIAGTPIQTKEPLLWSGRRGRLFFGYSTPLESGELLASAVIVGLFSLRKFGLKLLVIGALYYLLILTHSRNFLYFLPIALALGIYQQGTARLRFIVMSGVACAFMLLIVYLFTIDIVSFLNRDIGTLNGRTPLWARAMEVVYEHPVLGVGYYASRYFLIGSHFFAGHTHNAYVETLMTTGIVGFALMLAFIVYCINLSFNSSKGVLTTFLVLCLMGSMFNPIIIVTNTFTFCLIVAAFVVAEHAVGQKKIAGSNLPQFVHQPHSVTGRY